jgi:hypothetical protein
MVILVDVFPAGEEHGETEDGEGELQLVLAPVSFAISSIIKTKHVAAHEYHDPDREAEDGFGVPFWLIRGGLWGGQGRHG